MKRYLEHDIEGFSFHHNKMVFISGPRQVGKTFLAKMLAEKRASSAYYNWDDITFRRLWVKNPNLIIPEQKGKGKPLLVLDEIHKTKDWKRRLKGLFDTLVYPCDIIVTGSARLDIYRKGGDSLLGRYHHLHLYPLSLAELCNPLPQTPDSFLELIKRTQPINGKNNATVKQVEKFLSFSGFPEPFMKADKRFYNVWKKNRSERIIKEDLRDLSRLPELAKLELLASLLPEKIGSPLSIQSLSEDFEVSYPTMKRWLTALQQLYYIFPVPPFHRNIGKAIKKSGKIYLWDWAEVENDGARLENMVASHLQKACDFWTDFGYGHFSLALVRDKNQHEVDFAVIKDKKVWMLVEVKTKVESLSAPLIYFTQKLQPRVSIQISLQPKKTEIYEVAPSIRIIQTSVADFLRVLV